MNRKITVNNNVKTLRKMQGLTQEELAKMTNTTRQTINRLEKGHTQRPDDDLIINISTALGKPVNEVFFTHLVKHVFQK